MIKRKTPSWVVFPDRSIWSVIFKIQGNLNIKLHFSFVSVYIGELHLVLDAVSISLPYIHFLLRNVTALFSLVIKCLISNWDNLIRLLRCLWAITVILGQALLASDYICELFFEKLMCSFLKSKWPWQTHLWNHIISSAVGLFLVLRFLLACSHLSFLTVLRKQP